MKFLRPWTSFDLKNHGLTYLDGYIIPLTHLGLGTCIQGRNIQSLIGRELVMELRMWPLS